MSEFVSYFMLAFFLGLAAGLGIGVFLKADSMFRAGVIQGSCPGGSESAG